MAGPQFKSITAWNKSLHSSVRKCVGPVLSCWTLVRTISHRPLCTASAICCMLSIGSIVVRYEEWHWIFAFLLRRDSNPRTLIQNETVSFKKSKIKFCKMQYCSCLFFFFLSRPPIPTIFSEKGPIFTSFLKLWKHTISRVFHWIYATFGMKMIKKLSCRNVSQKNEIWTHLAHT